MRTTILTLVALGALLALPPHSAVALGFDDLDLSQVVGSMEEGDVISFFVDLPLHLIERAGVSHLFFVVTELDTEWVYPLTPTGWLLGFRNDHLGTSDMIDLNDIRAAAVDFDFVSRWEDHRWRVPSSFTGSFEIVEPASPRR